MPAKSKAQYKFMQAAAHGEIKVPSLSKKQAKEFVSHNVGSKRYSRLKEMIKKK